MNTPSLIKLDGRRRAALARFSPTHDYYYVTVAPNGTITLTPATVSVTPAADDDTATDPSASSSRQRPSKKGRG